MAHPDSVTTTMPVKHLRVDDLMDILVEEIGHVRCLEQSAAQREDWAWALQYSAEGVRVMLLMDVIKKKMGVK